VRFSLRLKIIGGFLVAVLATLALGVYATSTLRTATERSDASARYSEDKVSTIGAVETKFILGNLYASTMFLSGDPQISANARPRYIENTKEATDLFLTVRDDHMSAKATTIYNRVLDAVSWNNKLANSYNNTGLPVPDESVAIPTVEELIATGGKTAEGRHNEMVAGLGDLRQQIRDDAAAARADVKADADASLERLNAAVAGICLSVLAFAVGLSYFLVRRLRSTVKVLNQVADGDLTARAPEGGSDEVAEMGAALNSSLNTLHDVVCQIEEDADRLATLAREQAPVGAVAGHPSGTSLVMTNSGHTSDELAEMADNLSAMIMVFQTAKDPEPVG
jgi:methyl-accepting chemotaxis protein